MQRDEGCEGCQSHEEIRVARVPELKHGLACGEAKVCLRRGSSRGVKHDKGNPGRKVCFKS